jgi:hypothetical protein
MPDDLEARLLEALIGLVESVTVPERFGYYETTYWFDDETTLQVIEFHIEYSDEEGEPNTYDYSFQLRNDRFDVLVIGYFSDAWNYDLDAYEHPDQCLEWLGESHVVVRMTGTD